MHEFTGELLAPRPVRDERGVVAAGRDDHLPGKQTATATMAIDNGIDEAHFDSALDSSALASDSTAYTRTAAEH